MMKRKGFENLSIIVVSAIMAVACSPMAPSVSKLSNAAGDKSTPTDGSAPSNSVSSASSIFSSNHGDAATGSATQSTVPMPFSSFRKQWSIKQDTKPTVMLDKSAAEDLANNGVVSFASGDKVKGNESQLAASRIKIFLVTNGDQAAIIDSGVDKVSTQLKWVPGASAHWELSLAAPDTGDGSEDQIDLKAERDALHHNVVAIAVEFQAD